MENDAEPGQPVDPELAELAAEVLPPREAMSILGGGELWIEPQTIEPGDPDLIDPDA
jgi:hypothetical protein